MTFQMTETARTVTTYNLRGDTNEFIGKSDCYIPAHTGLPANTTTTAPPEIPAGSVAVYNVQQDSWSLKEDHRGQMVYRTQDGSQLLVTELGAIPEGTVATAPTAPYMTWDGEKWVHDAEAEKAVLQEKVESQRQSLLTDANNTIADWRTELQLDVISDDDKASLIKWMAYIKALKALDFTSITDDESYKAILWPEKP